MIKIKRLTRVDLSKRIYKSVGKAIPCKTIQQALGVIISQIEQDLIDNQVISVRHFGTLSPHIRKAHLARDVSTDCVRTLPATKSVKFHPHQSFLSLLKERDVRFRQKKHRKTTSKNKKENS